MAMSNAASSAGPGMSIMSASSAMPLARLGGIDVASTPSTLATWSSGIARRSDRSSSARVPASSRPSDSASWA